MQIRIAAVVCPVCRADIPFDPARYEWAGCCGRPPIRARRIKVERKEMYHAKNVWPIGEVYDPRMECQVNVAPLIRAAHDVALPVTLTQPPAPARWPRRILA